VTAVMAILWKCGSNDVVLTIAEVTPPTQTIYKKQRG